MALIISTWIWGSKYSGAYIAKLRRGLQRHLKQPYRFFVVETWPGDEPLQKGCFCRLRMFAPDWQRFNGIMPGDRLVCLDLDIVITGPLDPLFDRDDTFTIFAGSNAASHPCPVNGSVMMLRAGYHPEVWDDFTLDAACKIPFADFPDDQGWIHHKLPKAATWHVGPSSGIYAFAKAGWPSDNQLPADARIVACPGNRDPAQFVEAVPWVRECWR
jgi:hypothetical protein